MNIHEEAYTPILSTKYELFSSDPAVSGVADTPILDLEINILCSVLLHLIEESRISLFVMVAFRWDKWNWEQTFLQYYLGNTSLITCYRCMC